MKSGTRELRKRRGLDSFSPTQQRQSVRLKDDVRWLNCFSDCLSGEPEGGT